MDWRGLKARLRGSADRDSVESQMKEEMQFHVDKAIERYVGQGLAPREARRRARIDFGAMEAVKEDAREASRARPVEHIANDLRFAWRSLRRSPAFTIAAVLTVALGIGANTAVFSVVHGVLGSLPLPRPQDIAYVGWKWDDRASIPALTGYQFEYVRRNAKTFQAITTYQSSDAALGDEVDAPMAHGLRASADFFTVLGITPSQGRGFTADEDRHNGADVVVISDALWRGPLNADPAILGRTLRLGGTTRTVIGVMPAAYRFPADPERTDFIAPLGLETNIRDEGHNYTAVARAKDGSTLEQRAAEVAALTRAFQREHPELANEKERFLLFTHTEAFVGDLQKTLWIFFGAVTLVLVIACANTANLLLVRSVGREREIAVRAALGAGRGRIFQQLLTEGLVVSSMAAVVGMAVGFVALRTILGRVPGSIPRASEVGVDGSVLAYVLAVTLGTGVLFGLAAALPARRLRLQDTLKAIRSTGARRRARDVLVFVETTLAVVLLSGAGLLIASYARLQSVDPGFDPTKVIAVRLGRPPAVYASAESRERLEADVLARVRAVPGVVAAAAASNFPLERGLNFPVDTPDHPELAIGGTELRAVTAGYISALRLTLRAGRDFEAQDASDGERVAIVNEKFARHFWPGKDAPGQIIQVGHFRDKWIEPALNRPTRVIGVVSDMKEIGLDRAVRPTVMLLRTQARDGSRPAVIVRAERPDVVMAGIRAALAEVDPRLQPELERMTAIVGRSIAVPRFRMLILSVFAACALLLAAIGIYGVVAALVQQQTREIGVRMALGATQRSVALGVLRRCMTLVGSGAVAGTLLALALTRTLTGMLFGVAPNDPRTFVVVLTVLCAVGVAAGYIPARRAARLDPTRALRAE
jgi:predicted permease